MFFGLFSGKKAQKPAPAPAQPKGRLYRPCRTLEPGKEPREHNKGVIVNGHDGRIWIRRAPGEPLHELRVVDGDTARLARELFELGMRI